MADPFRVYDNVVGLASLTIGDNIVDNILLVKIVPLRNQNILRAVCHTAPKRDISRIPAHNLNDVAAFMGGRGIPYLVDGLHCRVDGRVKANSIFRTGNIKINSPRNTDGVDSVSCQCLSASVRTVAADYHNTVNTVLSADFRSPLLHFFFLKLKTPCRTQDRSASLDDVGHVLLFHIYDLFV